MLILFSDTGGGHRAAAKALEQALLQLDPGIKITKLDPLLGADSSPPLVRRLAGLYSPIIRRSPAVWGALYHSLNNRPAFAAVRGVFGGRIRRIIVQALKELDPDLVLFGGGMIAAGQKFLDDIRADIRSMALPVPAARPRIGYAELGGDAGFIGAAGCARMSIKTPAPPPRNPPKD